MVIDFMATLLQIVDVKKSYAGVPVLAGADLVVSERQKIGLIGRNGAGKSTLLRLVMGTEMADEGEVVRFPQLRIGYLEQLSAPIEGETVASFLARQSGQPDWACAKAAGGFGIKGAKLAGRFDALSNGWQMRAKLAALLLNDPNLLLLDEPTNYLDLSTLLLLETFLKKWRQAFIVVSHDREFLSNVCNETAEVERGKVTFFPGPIGPYFEQKERQLETLQRFNKNVEAERRHLQRFIDRFSASKATQAQSKMKALAKLETVEIAGPLNVARIRIKPVEPKDGTALWVTNLDVGYDAAAPVISSADFEVRRGERLAIVGENGSGKSTLLKTFTGELTPLSGRFKWHPHLSIGVYAPHRLAELDPQQLVRGYLWSCATPGTMDEQILRAASDMLFRNDDLDKRLGSLSGGERARLCLAGLFLGGHQVLILDEPTNHLDVETSESLGNALTEWGGTLLFVSHDRTFVNLLASAVLEVKDGHVGRFPGTYEEYVWSLRQDLGVDSSEQTPLETVEVKKAALIDESVADGRVGGGKTPKKLEILKEASKMVRLAERQLESLRAEREKILAQFLADPTTYVSDRYDRLQQLEKMIADEEERWVLWEGKKESI